MKNVFLWLGVYLGLFASSACLVLHADSMMDVIVALNLLTCTVTFAYTFCLRGRIEKRPDSMLSFVLLWLLFVIVCCPFVASIILK
ncbi:MAG: hypothetical protein J6U17_03640 [Kiritimatiellae bacterium]|nr:hypothetical protein [Kiritimatiellia bacterium]